jgi:dihydroorotase
MRYCVKNGEIIDPAGGYVGAGDLLIESGKIVAIGAALSVEDAQMIAADGKIVCPGFIDMHCHLREPGREDAETIASGTKAAVKGGFTAVASMANTNPVADTPVTIEYIRSKAAQAGWAKVYPVGAITKGLKGEELAEMGELAAAGAVAFSDDGKTIMNAVVLRSAMEYSTLFGLPLLLHQEDPNLAGNGVMHEGYWSMVLGLPGIPDIAESTVVGRDLQIAEMTGAKIHLCHLSTARSVALLQTAKTRGIHVTAEATPHHFSLTDEKVQGYNPVYRVSPPLRSAADVAAVKAGLRDGTIDAIATDHAPHTAEEKHREFSLALTGMIGLETALAVAWTELVRGGWLTQTQLIERMAVAPARILNRPGGRLQPGDPADVVIFDPNREWEVKPEDLVSQSHNSPFLGRKLYGKVETVWVEGTLKYCNEKFIE